MKQHKYIWLAPFILGCVSLVSACGGSQATGTAGGTTPAGSSIGGGAGSNLQFTGALTGTFTQSAACVTGPTGLSVAVTDMLSDNKQYIFQIIVDPNAGTFTAAQGTKATLTDLTAGGSFYGATTQVSDVSVTVQSGAQSGSVTATMPYFQDLTTPVPGKSIHVSGTWACQG
jgi:hypothetical protein